MELSGDTQGLAQLKRLKETNVSFLKFLLQEVKTSFEGKVAFKGPDDGAAYYLVRDGKDADKLSVEKA